MEIRVVSRDFRIISRSYTIDVYDRKSEFATSCDTQDGVECEWLYKPYDYIANDMDSIVIPELYNMSEEELFQESLVSNYGDVYFALKVQNFIRERFLFFKNNLGVHDFKE